jgi:hypothetical protein
VPIHTHEGFPHPSLEAHEGFPHQNCLVEVLFARNDIVSASNIASVTR